jgi:hypothetical protein
MAYFTSQSARPTVGQELAVLEEQIDRLEQRKEAGVAVAPEVHLQLAQRIAGVAEKIGPDQTQSAVVAQELIERQKKIAADSPVAPQVEAQLAPVEERVVRIAAASVQATLPPTTRPAASPTASGSPVTAAAAAPSATTQPAPAATLEPLEEGQARLRLLPGDSNWSEFSTIDFSIQLPTSWTISGPSFGANGLTRLETNWIIVNGPNVTLRINVGSAEIQALIDGQLVLLRTEDGDRILAPDLLAAAGGERAVILNRILDSVVYTPATPTPEPTDTPTRAPAPTATPRP